MNRRSAEEGKKASRHTKEKERWKKDGEEVGSSRGNERRRDGGTNRERKSGGKVLVFYFSFFSLTFVWREMKRFPGLFTFRLFMREPGVVSTLEQTTEGRIA